MRTVHISDFHLTKEGLNDFHPMLLKALIRDLKRFNEEKKIDLIAYTGDLVDRGGQSFGTIDEAFKQFKKIVIEPILGELGLDNNRFIFTPGNHDINHSEDDKYEEKGLRESLISNDEIKEFLNDRYDGQNTKGMKRIISFKDFERDFHDNNKGITNFQSCYIIEINGKKIGIAAFNTAWRCYGSDEKVLLGIQQIINAKNYLENCDIRIALMHHQMDYLSHFESELVIPYISRDFDMMLSGHVHNGSSYVKSSIYGDLLISVSPMNSASNTLNNDVRYTNGYTIVDFFYEEAKFQIINRKYGHNFDEFIPNVDLAPANGISVYYKPGIPETKVISNVQIFNYQESNDLVVNDYLNEMTSKTVEIKNDTSEYILATFFETQRENILKILNTDMNTTILSQSFDIVLLIIDRLLIKFKVKEDEKKLNEFKNFMIHYSEISEKLGNKNKSIIELFGLTAWWLQNLLDSLKINEDIFNDEGFNLVFNNLTGSYEENSLLKALMEDLKDSLNLYHNKNDLKLSLKSETTLLDELTIAFVLPVLIRLNLYREECAGLEFEKKKMNIENDVLDGIYNEFSKDNLESFNIWGEIEETIHNSVIKNNFTILSGKKRTGKTSIIKDYITNIVSYSDRRVAPIFLFFSFKVSVNLTDLIICIVEQCNMNLVSKIDLTAIKEDSTLEMRNIEVGSEGVLVAKYELFMPLMIEALKRLVKECGDVILIIDSLELVESLNTKLQFLLESIPCKLILITGENKECVNWITKNNKYIHQIIEIDGVLSNEQLSSIPSLKLLEEKGKLDEELRNQIHLKTKGKITEIRKIISACVTSDHFDMSAFHDYENTEDNRNYEKELDKLNSSSMLEEIIILISMFQQIQPIPIDYLQSFLFSRNFNSRMPKIRRELRALNSQIGDLKFNRVQLLDSNFALFVLNKYYSRRDIESFAKSVFEWMITDMKISLDFLSQFLKSFFNENFIDIEDKNSLLSYFLNNFNNPNKVYELGKYLLTDATSDVELSLEILTKAVELDDSNAEALLGIIYYKGEKVVKDIDKAITLLRKSSSKGNTKAKMNLSTMLFQGDGIYKDVLEAEVLLEEAAKLGNDNAKFKLAIRLIFGKGMKIDVERGNKLLEELAEIEYIDAQILRGSLLLRSHELNDVSEGETLLKKSIEKGSKRAKLELARYYIFSSQKNNDRIEGEQILIDLVNENYPDATKLYSRLLIEGAGVKKDVQKGISYLEKVMESGDDEATFEYSKLLIEGIYVPQDISNGLQKLEHLANSGYPEAVGYHGDLLIEGNVISKDIEKGIELILTSGEKGEAIFKRKLAIRYLYGEQIEKDFELGIKILKELIEDGDVTAKCVYALALINQRNFNMENKDVIIELLKEAEKVGFSNSKLHLGDLYLEGKFVDRDTKKGIEYLDQAIELGNTRAMNKLAMMLINGTDIAADVVKGEKLLRKSIALGDTRAKTILSNEILLGDKVLRRDIEEGFNLLNDAVGEQDSNAMRILGNIYIQGIYEKKDKNKGISLLYESMNKNNETTMLQISTMLMRGDYLKQDKQKGLEILMALVQNENEDALITYSKILLNGELQEKNIKEAIRILEDLVLKNNFDAKLELSKVLLIGGEGIVKNIEKGELLLREVASGTHNESKRFLAECLVDKILIENNDNEVIDILEEAINSQEGDQLAAEYLADLYYEGKYTTRDVDKCVELYELSLKGTKIEPKVRYALMLIVGVGDLIPKDTQRALKIIKEAVDMGNSLGRFEYSKILINGYFIKKNVELGLEILNELIEEGDLASKRYFALMLTYGHRVNRDIEKAKSLYEELIIKEYAFAIDDYANFLISGVYFPRDLNKGEKLLKQLGQYSQTISYELGLLYLDGKGIKKHISNGRDRLSKAAHSDHINAMFELGLRLKRGIKLGKDTKKGSEYIQKALNQCSIMELHALGLIAYRLKDYDLAIKLFIDAYENGVTVAGNSLAYMIRRREVKLQEVITKYSVLNLLEKDLRNNEVTAILNLVLSFVLLDPTEEGWVFGDKIIRTLDDCNMEVQWWFESAEENDAESQLILGWLSKYNLINDPYNMNYKQRLDIAKKNGMSIPKWLYTL
ncbi:metallophosphoesterase [Paenibacillus taichungensis]